MGLSITPDSPVLRDWEFHPTVMTRSVGPIASLSLVVPSFALSDADFQSKVILGLNDPDLPYPSIVIDTLDCAQMSIIPFISTASVLGDLKFQLIGWNWSISANAWIGMAITHYQSARAGMSVMQYASTIEHPLLPGTLFKPMERIGVTTASDADGGLGIVPLPKHYDVMPAEGLVSSTTSSHASPATILVRNYGWKYVSLHIAAGVAVLANVSAMCMYKRESGVFK